MKKFTCLSVVLIHFSVISQIDSVINNFLDKNAGSGVCVSTLNQLKKQNYCVGFVNDKKQVLLKEKDNYEIGSITKTFTGLLIYEEIKKGNICLEDPISKFIPDLNIHLNTITIKELLTHTSGLGNNPRLIKRFKDDPTISFDKKMLLKDLLGEKINNELVGEIHYSNLGVCILGLCLENLNNQPIKDIYSKLLLDLNMNTSNVDFYYVDSLLIAGHKNGKETKNFEFNYIIPAGGIHSNIIDMGIYLQEMMSLLEKDSVFCKSLFISENDEIGMLWFKKKLKNNNYLFWHNGETNGYANYIGIIPEMQIGVVVLSNEINRNIDDLGIQIINQLIREKH